MTSGSKYRYFEAGINDGWKNLEGTAMDADEYAKIVIPNIIKPNAADEFWCGSGAWKVRFIETFRLRWLYSHLFLKMYGLDRMAPPSKRLT